MNENLSPGVMKKILKELQQLQSEPLEGIKVVLNDNNMLDIMAWISGPDGTPYEGGAFKVKITLGNDFPVAPPKGYFETKIFHPNVSDKGEICVSTLKKDWKKELGIAHILLTIKCLLIVPNPESALNEEAGRLLLEEYEEFAKRAKVYTQIHAKSKIDFTIPKASSSKTPESVSNKSEDTVCDSTPESPKVTNQSEWTVLGEDVATGNEKVKSTSDLKEESSTGTTSLKLKKRVAEKKLEKGKNDKKRTLRRL
ncbi:Ubiquitin-conjugating enzyme E2 S-C [Nowakowskiella sp. JEL0407]|nr:Ubiquitin-conjugating enzyme E2 S-C [Nowakowskiella sp. JEL0407]